MVGIRGQITPCTSPEIGEIRKDLLASFEKFKEDKPRQKELEAEIGRKGDIQKMMATNPHYDFEGFSSVPQTDTSNLSDMFLPLLVLFKIRERVE